MKSLSIVSGSRERETKAFIVAVLGMPRNVQDLKNVSDAFRYRKRADEVRDMSEMCGGKGRN